MIPSVVVSKGIWPHNFASAAIEGVGPPAISGVPGKWLLIPSVAF